MRDVQHPFSHSHHLRADFRVLVTIFAARFYVIRTIMKNMVSDQIVAVLENYVRDIQ